MADEKGWVGEYLWKRAAWLTRNPRLKKTALRPNFFLAEITRGNWGLELPLTVKGITITEDILHDRVLFAIASGKDADGVQGELFGKEMTAGTGDHTGEAPPEPREAPSQNTASIQDPPPGEQSHPLRHLECEIYDAAEKYDRVEDVVRTVLKRGDSAKSLWTTVIGTLWQTVWGVAGFISGMPREIWFAVAVIAGALMLAYLYRQITLGRIRDAKS
jgi:hypothetical protein